MAELAFPLAITLLLVALGAAKRRLRLVLTGVGIQVVGGILAGLAELIDATDLSEWMTRAAFLSGFVVALVGALGLAKPDSVYARRLYGKTKLLRAEARFHESLDVRARAGDALEVRRNASLMFGCRVCGQLFETPSEAEHHVEVFHAEQGPDPAQQVESVTKPDG